MRVWYRVRDLDASRDFYTRTLGFTETAFDMEARWSELEHGQMKIALTQGEPEEGGVATVDVRDVKAEAERLRAAGVEVGTVLELHGEVRLLDVFDPDGNRVQFAEDLKGEARPPC
jgi:catechol 2,3-dioxygenase-like lactoylglutathione lyase family enzyme